MSIVSGSHTVELPLYYGDVALQCESIPMWCSELYTVSSLTIYCMLDHCASQLKLLSSADSVTTNICMEGVFIVQMVFIGMADTITVGKTRTVSENVLTADFTHLIIQIADGPDTCIFL